MWVEPHFVSPQPSCAAFPIVPYQSDYAIWTGLGGDSNAPTSTAYASAGGFGLLQQGTDVYPCALDEHYAWYEAINGAHDTHMIEIPSLAIRGGDQIQSSTTFSDTRASFSIYNATTGVAWSTGLQSNIDGLPAASYFDGSSADFIVERDTKHEIPGGATLNNLRRPANGVMNWQGAYTNAGKIHVGDPTQDHPTGAFPIEMFGSGRNPISIPSGLYDTGSGYLQQSGFSVFWNGCN